MRRNNRPARGLWTLLQAAILLGLGIALAGGVMFTSRGSEAPETPHKLGPAGTATLTDTIEHDLDNCRVILENGGKIENC